jgi:hypothetical protein
MAYERLTVIKFPVCCVCVDSGERRRAKKERNFRVFTFTLTMAAVGGRVVVVGQQRGSEMPKRKSFHARLSWCIKFNGAFCKFHYLIFNVRRVRESESERKTGSSFLLHSPFCSLSLS